MPFGLINAPASLQRRVNKALYKYLDVFVTVYINDILVYFKIKEEHKKHIRKILKIFKKKKFIIKYKKSTFLTQKVGFLGYIIISEKVLMEYKKVKTIAD